MQGDRLNKISYYHKSLDVAVCVLVWTEMHLFWTDLANTNYVLAGRR